MFLLYFLLPVMTVCLLDYSDFLQKGIKNKLKNGGFWIRLLLCQVFSLVVLVILFMDFTAFLSFSWLKLMAVAISMLLWLILGASIRYFRRKSSVLLALIPALLIAIFLEGTVFNFRFYQSYDYVETDCTELCLLSNKWITTGQRENEYTINGASAYIDLYDLDTKIRNIYVDITARNANDAVVSSYVNISMTDDSNKNYLDLPTQTLMAEVESTKYMYLVTSGNSDRIRLTLFSDYAETYQINGIRLNVSQPFRFEYLRVAIVALLIFLFILLRPSGKMYSYLFNDSSKQKLITAGVIALEITILLLITVLNPIFSGNPSRHTAQYQELAEAFLDGQLYLDQEPPEFLAEMENPYDYTERAQQAKIHDSTYYWDAAYFEGRYYVYFGVVPVLLLYLPFRFITGMDLPNVAAIQIFLCFFVLGAFLLIGQIIKKYFRMRRIPYLSYLIVSLIFVNAAGAVFIAKRPDFYSIPILSGVTFTLFGLYFWMRSDTGEGRIHPIYAGLGSLCMALVAGCRPQLLLASGMAFVIFWTSVFKDRSLFSKKGWKSSIAICLPYILIAAGIMWYNAARFGSPFDFGANYNLTTNDMTGRGFRVERVGLSIFTYFFQFPNITADFPFLQSVSIENNYLGRTITEPMFGGIFAVIPLLWILILLPSKWRELQKNKIFALCLVPLIVSFVIGIFDAQGAGLLQRYVSDFSFLACLSAVILVFFLYEQTLGSQRKWIHSFVRFALFSSGVYCFMCIFAKYSVEIFYRNPYLFNRVAELVQFW